MSLSITAAPIATLLIMGVALVIALVNTGINRALIGYFVGWDKYRAIQKEMAEFRSESMAAARSNDKKQMEKIRKRQSQINAMQAQTMKPQMLQMGISFLYIIVWWFFLIPVFGSLPDGSPNYIAYIPGFGPVTVLYWYPIASFFLGLLIQRLIGIMPIE
jgi:uncharacterized membrane protein (DUF106 family)